MTVRRTGTIVGDSVTLDQPVELPDRCRVRVTIEPVAETDVDRRSPWEEFEQLLKERPLHSGGLHYTRDELHERC